MDVKVKDLIMHRLDRVADDAGDNLDRAGEYTSGKIIAVKQQLEELFVLRRSDGLAVREILNRYLDELEEACDQSTAFTGKRDRELEKDIDYITGLAKLFD